jgi:hypothetical protein
MQRLANKLAQAEENLKAGSAQAAGAPLAATTPVVSSTGVPVQWHAIAPGQTTFAAQPGQMTFPGQPVPAMSTTAIPTTVIQDAPVVKETIREREIEEIQPVLHREIEQPIIKKVTAPMTEVCNVEEQQIYTRAAPEFREVTAGGLSPEQQALLAQKEFSESQRYVTHQEVVLPTKVQEVVKEKIVEEVQPVIYREVNIPRTIHLEKDIYEKQVLPTKVVQEVRPMGTFTAPLASQFTSSTQTTGTTTHIPITSSPPSSHTQ